MPNTEITGLLETAAAPYRAAGRYPWHFARGKLRGDPIFVALLREGLLPDEGELLDLGCGQGLLMALLLASRQHFAADAWPADWPKPPMALAMRGIELDEKRVKAAQVALGDAAGVEAGDLRQVSLPTCTVITIFDVLFYMDRPAQRRVLENCAQALAPDGLLLLRETDASQGLRFYMTRWAERLMCWSRGQFRQPLSYRRREEWLVLLSELGFRVTEQPMSAGTPFSNRLFIARRVKPAPA